MIPGARLQNPVDAFLLDFILAAKVEEDFENAPPDCPYAIWIGYGDDSDIAGAGSSPTEAIEDAHAQIAYWYRSEEG